MSTTLLYALVGAVSLGLFAGMGMTVASPSKSEALVLGVLGGGIGATLGALLGIGLALAQLLDEIKGILRQNDDDPRATRARALLARLDDDDAPPRPWSAGEDERG